MQFEVESYIPDSDVARQAKKIAKEKFNVRQVTSEAEAWYKFSNTTWNEDAAILLAENLLEIGAKDTYLNTSKRIFL